MLNPHSIQLINNNKDVILNHFGPTFYFSVMTNKPHPKNANVDLTRDTHGHAHVYVQKFTVQENNFKDFDSCYYYYITSSIYEVNNTRCLTLREDLINSWAKVSNRGKNTRVLVLDEGKSQLYDVDVTDLISLYAAGKAYSRKSVNFTGFTYVAFDLDDLGNPEAFNTNEYKGVYDRQYLDASYIGNTTYTKFRTTTNCYLSVFDKNGNAIIWDKSKCYRSLKEAYEALCSVANVDISYKTFQRRFATGDAIVTNNGAFIYVTKEINNSQTIDVKAFEKEDSNLGTVNKSNIDIEIESIEKINNASVEEKENLVETIENTAEDAKVLVSDFGDEPKDASLSQKQISLFKEYLTSVGYGYVTKICKEDEDWLYYMRYFQYDVSCVKQLTK